jgi:S1-C subfamily serine protease
VIVGRYRFLIGGDIIVALDGEPVGSVLDINRITFKQRPGDTVEVTYYRGDSKRTVEARLSERPTPGQRRRRRL